MITSLFNENAGVCDGVDRPSVPYQQAHFGKKALQASQVAYHRYSLAHSCLVKSFQVIGKQQNGCHSVEDFEGAQICTGLEPKSAQLIHCPASNRLRAFTRVVLTSISALSS